MKTRLLSLTLLLALFAGVGCDSNDNDEPTDADLFVGTWTVAKIRNNSTGSDTTSPTNQDITPFIFGANGSVKDNGFVFTFRENKTYKLMVDYKSDATTDLVVDGAAFTYSVTPSADGKGTLNLQLPSPAGSGTVQGQAGYELTSNTAMTATIPSLLMNSIFGTTLYKGTVAVEFTKQ